MFNDAWRLDRRTLLRGLGGGIGLPWLEAMGPVAAAGAEKATPRPRRFCGVYFANGVALPGTELISKDSRWNSPLRPELRDWHWFPYTTGADYQFNKSLEPLAPHRADFTILGGLSHPSSREVVGHSLADVWLTGANITAGGNSVSLDQLIAREVGHHTRVASLVLSSHGGIGPKNRATTISVDGEGRAIPAESKPRQIFERLFTQGGEGDRAARQRALTRGRRRVDFLLEDARMLRRRLGQPDQRRLDEFLQSMSEVEGRLVRAEKWIDEALPSVEPGRLNLDVSPQGPTDFIRTMFDLIVLAFETDTTRVATYQLSAEDSVGVCDKFPVILGLSKKGHHSISHDDMEAWAKYDRFISEQYAYFLDRLANVREGDDRLIDNLVCLYGSGSSTKHNARNYPLVLAGGKSLGLQHGRYLQQPAERPLGDLFVTLLHRFDVPVEKFADNAGEFTEIVA
jgi:hypothetical protein